MHRPHPDLHEHGLADDCDGCEKLADGPVEWGDRRLLQTLVARAHLRARDGADLSRTENQLRAEAHVFDLLTAFGRLATDAPGEVAAYLEDRWRLAVSIERRPR